MSIFDNREFLIAETFKSLIPPLSSDEYKKLESSILKEGCSDPIYIWHGNIIDGHNRYEICLRHNIPFTMCTIHLVTQNEAVAWICANQIGRGDITEETRKYLIGKRYEAEKAIGSTKLIGKIQHDEVIEDESEMWALSAAPTNWTRTSGRIGDEYNLSHSTVEKYGVYSHAIDDLADKANEFAQRILSGKTKLSHEKVVELAKLSRRELGRIWQEVIRSGKIFVGCNAMSRDLERRQKKSKPAVSTFSDLSIKDMPIFDPDAEISSLSLTIPSWISSIKRAEAISDLMLVSGAAKNKLALVLENLKEVADNLLGQIKE